MDRVNRDKRIILRATDLDIKAADILAEQMGVTRSEVIRMLIRDELEIRGLGPIVFLKDAKRIMELKHDL